MGAPARRADCQNAAPAAAQAPGTIIGTIVDRETGNPIIDAGIEIVGQEGTVRTGVDGKFSIRVKPGTYDLRVFGPLYQTIRIERVVVVPNKVLTADISLRPLGPSAMETVEVVALKKASEQAQLAKRKKEATVGETISAEEMRKSGGSDAADVVARAPAVLVKDEKYINIRGLQERYTSAVLNGSRLPSTNPQRRVVPLDLFPAGFLDSLAIVKSYTPNLPGDFSGGLAELDLRDFPDELTYSLGISGGANTQATFRDFNTYRGSHYDYLGFGTDFRALPAGMPGSQQDFVGLGPRGDNRVARQFRDIWAVKDYGAPPNFGTNFSIGNKWGPFGFQFAALYGTNYKHRRNEIANNFTNVNTIENPELGISDSLLYDRSYFDTKLGGLLTAGYDLAPGHRITFRALYDRNTDDQVSLGQGFRRNDQSTPIRQQTLQYTQEGLQWDQLGGEHHWSWINLDWRTAYSQSSQKQPDTRFFTQVGQSGIPANSPDQVYSYVTDSLSGSRVFNNLREWLSDSALDFTIPFQTRLPFTDVWSGLPASFKFGQAYSYRSRTFSQRRFRLRPQCGTNNAPCVDPTLPPEELFGPNNIGVDGFELVEEDVPRDSYTVSQEIAGAYGLFEIPIIKDHLRVVGGARYEYSYIQLNGFAETSTPTGEPIPVKTIKNNNDPMPGVNVILNPIPDMNLRFAWSRTVSRPDFRELSPTQYLAPLGTLEQQGNPNLVQSTITSFDARWEWFFSPLEIVSLGFFHKKLELPIEETVLPQSSNSIQSWNNAVDGHVTGFEFEGRKNLGFLSPHLSYLSLSTNVTYATSEVFAPNAEIPGVGPTATTNTRRALQGQAPYIVNAGLDFAHPRWGSFRLSYNTIGPYLVLVGTQGVPDVSQDRHQTLDFSLTEPLQSLVGFPLSLSFNVENILNERINWTVGQSLATTGSTPIFRSPGVQNGVYQRYTTGITFTLGLSYSF